MECKNFSHANQGSCKQGMLYMIPNKQVHAYYLEDIIKLHVLLCFCQSPQSINYLHSLETILS
jgi:hypothetical protein